MATHEHDHEEPPAEKYADVVVRYFADQETPFEPDTARALDVAIERLCVELSRNNGSLENLRLLQEAEDEWAGLRALLPEHEESPSWENRPVIRRMEEVLTEE